MAEYFHAQIKTDLKDQTPEQKEKFIIFDESEHPLSTENIDFKNPPPISSIEKFIKEVFRIGQVRKN